MKPKPSHLTEPYSSSDFEQPVAAFIESIHSRNGFSRARMAPEAAAAFDADVFELLRPHAPDGVVRRKTYCTVTWAQWAQ